MLTRAALMTIVALAMLPTIVRGQPEAAAPATAGDESRPVTFKTNVEWITAVRGLDPAETPLNPGNDVLQLPQFWGQTELRPNVRVELGSHATFVVRPRLLAVTESSWAENVARRD